MASRYLTLEARTERPRNEAIRALLDVANAEEGFVSDAHPLGGLALVSTLELTPHAAATLGGRLRAEGIRLDASDAERLDAAARAGDHVVASLHLRFLADEPDLRVEVPKVPG